MIGRFLREDGLAFAVSLWLKRIEFFFPMSSVKIKSLLPYFGTWGFVVEVRLEISRQEAWYVQCPSATYGPISTVMTGLDRLKSGRVA